MKWTCPSSESRPRFIGIFCMKRKSLLRFLTRNLFKISRAIENEFSKNYRFFYVYCKRNIFWNESKFLRSASKSYRCPANNVLNRNSAFVIVLQAKIYLRSDWLENQTFFLYFRLPLYIYIYIYLYIYIYIYMLSIDLSICVYVFIYVYVYIYIYIYIYIYVYIVLEIYLAPYYIICWAL